MPSSSTPLSERRSIVATASHSRGFRRWTRLSTTAHVVCTLPGFYIALTSVTIPGRRYV